MSDTNGDNLMEEDYKQRKKQQVGAAAIEDCVL